MMTNPAHWPKTEEVKKTLGQVLWDTKTPLECLASRWEDRKESQREWCEQAARNVITEYEARRAPFAREHFNAGLKLGIDKALDIEKRLSDLIDGTIGHQVEADLLHFAWCQEVEELIKQSAGYPLTWQPKEETK